ncbi:MAG: hypothetical protein K0Q83_2510 [Deltaproteobacteria bacterium]|jgi:hypothetical protein|nr:hypothetical protein [Deltaproteobacteria bacterium]
MRLSERLIFLEAIPNMTGYDKISVGSNVKQQLENDMGPRWLPLQFSDQGYAPAWKPPTTHRENCSSTSWWKACRLDRGPAAPDQ